MSGSKPSRNSAPAPDQLSKSRIVRWLWLILAYACLLLALIGVILPGLPTTPFILLAAFAATRGSHKLRDWLHDHRIFGPMVVDWQREGAVSQRAKITATVTMVLCSVVMFVTAPKLWMTVTGTGIMLVVAVWLWLRPVPR